MNISDFTFTGEFAIGVIITAIAAYLIGSLNSAVIVSRVWKHDDIRNHGSGNAGMTNMLRTYGKAPAAVTAMGDFFKGTIAALVGRMIFDFMGITILDGGYIAGIFVLLGHLFPIYFGFKGGKGILTACGMILALNPLVVAILLGIYVPLVFIVKIVSVGSILGALSYPPVLYFLLTSQGKPAVLETILGTIMVSIIIYMHRENIVRLFNGTERSFKKKKE